jgi:hypothetical protein
VKYRNSKPTTKNSIFRNAKTPLYRPSQFYFRKRRRSQNTYFFGIQNRNKIFISYGEFILGEHNFIDVDLVFSGDTVNAEITIIDFEKFNGKLYTGLDFDFYEGEILMGKGVVTKILNKDLE